MEILNYNVLNVLKSYLPNKIFFNVSALCNNICYTPITQAELQRRICRVYLTPNWWWTCCPKHIHCIKYMLKKGMDIRQWNNYILRNSASRGNIKVLKYLLEKTEIGLDDLRKNDSYILRLSADFTCFKIIKYLIEQGLELKDIRSKNNYVLKTVIQRGRGKDDLNIVKYLMTRGITEKEVKDSFNITLTYDNISRYTDIINFVRTL